MKLPAKFIKIGYTKYKIQIWDKLTDSMSLFQKRSFYRLEMSGLGRLENVWT